MIQFNLLPDIKMEFIKARRAKRKVIFVSIVSAAAALFVLALLFAYVGGAQKKQISDLGKDIKSNDAKLNSVGDLNKILTIQNQLNSLTTLHDQKPVTSRLFSYMTALTPAQASISSLTIDFATSTISITGTTDGLSTVNKFADTLKFTKYAIKDQESDAKAFSNVVLTSFSRDSTLTSYQITATFDPLIFDGNSDVKLTVPKIISTRSETEKPSALFQQ